MHDEQLHLDGMPEPAENLGSGHLYVCIGDNGTVKIGRTTTTKGLSRRLADHRKHDHTMRMVASRLVPDVVHLETSLKRILADYVESRVAGTEWFVLTAYTGDLIADFLDRQGADTTRTRQAFAENIADRTHRWAR